MTGQRNLERTLINQQNIRKYLVTVADICKFSMLFQGYVFVFNAALKIHFCRLFQFVRQLLPLSKRRLSLIETFLKESSTE